MGELQKRIKEYFEDVLSEWSHLYEENIVEIVEEAKKEFPKLGTVVTPQGEEPQYALFWAEAHSWKKKWFGGEE